MPATRSTRPSADRARISTPSAADAHRRPPISRRAPARAADADDGHGDPERPRQRHDPGPDRREQRVGGDDEQPDVDVVHADPRLDEDHPVDAASGARRGPRPSGAGTGSGPAGRRSPAMSAPARTPGSRQANGLLPTSTVATAPLRRRRGSSWRSGPGTAAARRRPARPARTAGARRRRTRSPCGSMT